MKKRLFAIMSMAFALVLVMSSCKKEKVTTQNSENPSGENVERPSGDETIKNAVTDIDGNTYDAVKLGNQVWMAKNLRTTKYADGTPIPLDSSTSATTAYRYCPNGQESNVSNYGYLYNWKAVMGNSTSSEANPSGVQGICPNGWHVPSDAEWTQLTDYLSSHRFYVYGSNNKYIAKALAFNKWWSGSLNYGSIGENQSSNNATGFSAVPAGGHYSGHRFSGFGNDAYLWSTTTEEDDVNRVMCRSLNNEIPFVLNFDHGNTAGFSVRCVRD